MIHEIPLYVSPAYTMGIWTTSSDLVHPIELASVEKAFDRWDIEPCRICWACLRIG